MKLFHSPASPFVRKVMVVLHETDQLDDVALLDSVTTPLAPLEALQAANPLKKLPALMRDGAPTLYDSRVICAFLDDRAEAGLYGKGAAQWEIRTLEATADGMMDSGVAITYEARFRSEEKQSHEWMDAQWGKITSAIAALETRWMSHLSGPLNMGQIGIGCALGYLDFRHDARNWRADAPVLGEWFAQFSTRPSMLATKPD